MRGLIALCVGLLVVLGAGAASADDDDDFCCVCSCVSDSPLFCVDVGFDVPEELFTACEQACGDSPSSLECCKPDGTCVSTPDFTEVDVRGTGSGDDDDDLEAPLTCDLFPRCDGVPRFPQDPQPAPTASPYGIAALLIALGGFGAWRLREGNEPRRSLK
jgi:hypothetical protein